MDSPRPTTIHEKRSWRSVPRVGRLQSDVERQAALPLCFFLSTRKVHFRKESVSACAELRHFIRCTSTARSTARRQVLSCDAPKSPSRRDNERHGARLLHTK